MMNKLIIDAANENIFLMAITNSNTYNISHPNSKINYEKITILINDFLQSANLMIKDFTAIYINRGPGSFAGIRNSISVVKAINLALKIDYYCYSSHDFNNDNNFKYENVPNLCNKFKVKKNLVNPIYKS
jgi:tRNA threonylcarbamoyladenosine biosynthesis protein TsaB